MFPVNMTIIPWKMVAISKTEGEVTSPPNIQAGSHKENQILNLARYGTTSGGRCPVGGAVLFGIHVFHLIVCPFVVSDGVQAVNGCPGVRLVGGVAVHLNG